MKTKRKILKVEKIAVQQRKIWFVVTRKMLFYATIYSDPLSFLLIYTLKSHHSYNSVYNLVKERGTISKARGYKKNLIALIFICVYVGQNYYAMYELYLCMMLLVLSYAFPLSCYHSLSIFNCRVKSFKDIEISGHNLLFPLHMQAIHYIE